MIEQQFDVFLAHRSTDKPLVWQIYRHLKSRGLKPWLDEEELIPGTLFQEGLQQAIRNVKTAAICVGQGDLGSWQRVELTAIINQAVNRGIPVIPILLPGVEAVPEALLFLGEYHGVFFRDGIEDERALFQIEWGITGRKPSPLKLPFIPSPIEPINLAWAGDWFVNVGESATRTWEDCVNYGFISAGQGAVYSNALKNLKVGSTIYAYMSGLGYVGLGRVIKEAVPIKNFTVGQENTPLLKLELKAENPGANSDNLELSEWVVGIKWLSTFPKEQARRFVGAFANPNVACKLKNKRTLEFVRKEFGWTKGGVSPHPSPNPISPTELINPEWAGDWFVNVGEGRGQRSWEDCRRYGFISAGQGPQFAAAMRKLEVGSTVYAYVSGSGYVGFGKVVEKAVPIKAFTVGLEDTPLLEMDLQAGGLDVNSDDPEFSEWVARIEWLEAVPREQAYWFTGAFAHVGTLCKLRDQKTLDALHKKFIAKGDRDDN